MDGVVPVLLLAGTLLLLGVGSTVVEKMLPRWKETLLDDHGDLQPALVYGLPIMVCYWFVNRPLRFALGVGAIFLAAYVSDFVRYAEIREVYHSKGMAGLVEEFHRVEGNILHKERSFFGVLKVQKYDRFGYVMHTLSHGTTNHGEQVWTPEWMRDDPISYYHQEGPVGQIFDALRHSRDKKSLKDFVVALQERDLLSAMPGVAPSPPTSHLAAGVAAVVNRVREKNLAARPMAVVGLGTGTLACYAQRGQSLTFYEIDPAVVRIAQNPQYFTFFEDAQRRRADVKVVLGDARLRLREAPSQSYGIILVDAFSSDAIPVHLLTREALEIYMDKLLPHGLLAIHISNRHLDLEPVLGNLARDLRLMTARETDGDDSTQLKAGSEWVVMARSEEDFEELKAIDRRWQPARMDSTVGVWTDDFHNLLSVVDWKSVPVR
jgi:spermidine synthase